MLVSRLVGPRRSVVESAPTPEPAEGEILLEVIASGVCTSDIGVWRAGRLDGASPVLGHEVTGRVVGVGGDGMPSRWSVGDVVTGLADRAFATHVVLRADEAAMVPPGVDARQCLGEPLADVEESISRCGIRAGDVVAVIGLGFMGLSAMLSASWRLPSRLIAVDPDPRARRRALQLGADVAIHPDEWSADLAADVVIEVTGNRHGLATATRATRPFGTLCILGYHHDGIELDLKLWYDAVTIVNGFTADRRRMMTAMRDGLAHVADRSFPFAELITHEVGLADVDAAFTMMEERPDGFVKAVLVP